MSREGTPRPARRWMGVVVLAVLAAPAVQADEWDGDIASGRIACVLPYFEALSADNNPPPTLFGVVAGVELSRHRYLALEAGFSWAFDVITAAVRVGTTPIIFDGRDKRTGPVIQVAVLAEYIHGQWFDSPDGYGVEARHGVGLLVGLELTVWGHGSVSFWGRAALDVSYAPGWDTWDLNVFRPRDADRWWYYPSFLAGFAW